MAEKKDTKEKIKRIYDVLPRLDDQLCGYRSCGEFAKAVAEGKAPCYGCASGGAEVAAKVCEIMGVRGSSRSDCTICSQPWTLPAWIKRRQRHGKRYGPRSR